MNRKAFTETLKFIVRTTFLVGVPVVLAEVVKERPQYGAPIGFGLLAIDKYIHKLPNEYRGLFPL